MRQGFEKTLNLRGGIIDWVRQGNAVAALARED
jgi:hypothetical protein